MLGIINNICPNFPFSESNRPKGNFFLFQDSSFNPGDFLIVNTIISYIKANETFFFIGIKQNYAFYLNLLKKFGINLETFINNGLIIYIDLFSKGVDWIPEDLPMTEEKPFFWADLPLKALRVEFKENEEEFIGEITGFIEKNKEKLTSKAIIIDNIGYLANILDNKGILISFLEFFIDLSKEISIYCLITKDLYDKFSCYLIDLLKTSTDFDIVLIENPSGYSRDLNGQIQICLKQERKQFVYLYKLIENTLKIENYIRI